MYTLEQLRGFVAVAEHLHFGRAAESLQLTQPPLSRQIQKLEADLGVQLLTRTNRSVALTPAGTELLERARHILALAERSRSSVRSVAHGEHGTLAIGFTATSALSVLGPVLERLRASLPDVDIELRERVSSAQLIEIDREAIDLGLLRAIPHDARYGVRQLYSEDLVVAVPADHPLARDRRAVTIDDVVAHPMIGYAPGEAEYFRRKVERIAGDRPLRIVHSVTQILSILALVDRGIGVALVPRSTARVGPASVVFIDLAVPAALSATAHVSIAAVWSAASRNPALHRALQLLDAPLQP